MKLGTHLCPVGRFCTPSRRGKDPALWAVTSCCLLNDKLHNDCAIVVGTSKLTTLAEALPSSWNTRMCRDLPQPSWRGTATTLRFARSPACDLFLCKLHLLPPAACWCGPRHASVQRYRTGAVYCKRFALYNCSTMNTMKIWAADANHSGRAI